jgi:hypothetical protein
MAWPGETLGVEDELCALTDGGHVCTLSCQKIQPSRLGLWELCSMPSSPLPTCNVTCNTVVWHPVLLGVCGSYTAVP